MAVVVVASSASAQRTSRASSSSAPTKTLWELGGDGGLSFDLATDNGAAKQTTFSAPIQSIRAGFFINPDWSLEPSLGYVYNKFEGSPGVSVLTLGFAGLYHLSPNRMQRQMFVRPFFALQSISGGGTSASDEVLGVGVGLKWPKLGGRMALRGEVNLGHTMDAGSTSLGLNGGVSFYTR